MIGNKSITVIPARKRVGNIAKAEEKPKLKVAAYCRVSTDSDDQATSYEMQVTHYMDLIKKNSEWEFAGIFADDEISGTNTKKREEFNRMIDEYMVGNIDMIITKSISRFARNTLDCLKYIRQLKEKNVPVFFEKENINTMDSKGEVLLTIMASLAQQESESLSKNVKLGLQFRYQNGEVQVNHNRFLGYTKDEKGHLIIEPEGAEIVRRIYREYLEGASLKNVADGLTADGLLTAAGKPKWRANLRIGTDKNPKKRVYSSKYALSSIVYCGCCGDLYRRITWKARGNNYTNWRCATRVEKGPTICQAETISEKELQNAVVRAINKTLGGRDILLEKLRQNIESVMLDDIYKYGVH